MATLSKKRRATTLIELLISCGLLMICLTGVFLLVSAGSRYLRLTDDLTQMQRETIFALTWMVRDCSESDPTSVGNVSTTYQGFWCASPRQPGTGKVGYDSYGRMEWCKFVAYYLSTLPNASDKVLIRAWQATTDPKTGNYWLSPPTVDTIDKVVVGATGTRVVAHNLQALNVTISGTGAPSQIFIQCGLTSGMGKNYAIQAQSSVYCRN